MIRYGYIELWSGKELFLSLPMRKGWLILSVGAWLRFGYVKPKYKPWVRRWWLGLLKVEWHSKIGKESGNA